ncbi:efflux transporter periplasmic adaptor subunit [Agrobacterium salinitolerans]|uniref:Isoflavonoid efflux membrane-fusion protein n=1 Tax=Agrobacterium pusense TaxID=648995 RepID=U4Q4I9_9HYPH|nr:MULTISPECIES: efflux RND transporter periplasmic adaptor subunit [Agrobacterium]OOO27685.1 efflux transporter periplasmic adaptor subunit [Agrobacterium salinitolerans]PNQ25581.1 efflux RND transporter periplasmic adaptor subunit [Rhizobium sp. YIC5082]CDI12168.1 isoflavonoid efflux membrane-fusion protein [Agrobacterium pusense]
MVEKSQWRRGQTVALALILSCVLYPGRVLSQQQPTPSVTVETAKAADFTLTARLPGRIKPSTISEVRPQVSGIIRERLFEEGARVEAGQVLYKIEDETYVAAVESAKANVAQAQASYDFAVVDARRAEETFANNVSSASNRDNKIAERNKTQAALQVARAQLTTAQIDLERTTIRAPISGIIGFSETTAGALVAAQQTTALTTIRALDTIYVDVTQSVNDLLRWNADKRVGGSQSLSVATMILPNGQTYPIKGDLKAAEPRVEPTTGMVTLRISFSNPDNRLLPGLYVEVELPQAVTKDAILVPQSAVMRNTKGEASVWIVEGGKIVPRPVTIVTGAGNRWVTSSGLKPGDQIVMSGFQKVAPGASVEIEQQPVAQQAARVGSN